MSTSREEEPVDNADDEMRSEYDFRKLRIVGRGVYADRYRAGTNVALLAPDVRAAFPTDDAVNAALRTLMHAD